MSEMPAAMDHALFTSARLCPDRVWNVLWDAGNLAFDDALALPPGTRLYVSEYLGGLFDAVRRSDERREDVAVVAMLSSSRHALYRRHAGIDDEAYVDDWRDVLGREHVEEVELVVTFWRKYLARAYKRLQENGV